MPVGTASAKTSARRQMPSRSPPAAAATAMPSTPRAAVPAARASRSRPSSAKPPRSAATTPAPAAAERSTRSATGRTWHKARLPAVEDGFIAETQSAPRHLGALCVSAVNLLCWADGRRTPSAHHQSPRDFHFAGLNAEGDGDPEGGAFVRGAADADGAAEEVRQLAGDRESEARAAVGAGDGTVELAELLEDDRLLVGGDAGAVIGHGDAHVLGSVARRGQLDPAAGGGELDRVGQEVVQHLLQLAWVGLEDRHVRGHRGREREVFLLGE